MAAAARALDQRVPCPVCGGLVHPVAGKCKHCKADLRELRGPRVAAQVQLPALAPVSQPYTPIPLGTTGSGATTSAPIKAPAPMTPPADTSNGHSSNGHTPPRSSRSGYEPSPSQEPTLPVVSPLSFEQTGPHAVLPPRVTGRHVNATGTVRSQSALRHWPIVVIILAVIAILAAIALLVWPPPNDAAKKRASPAAAGPAPEHMDTNPLPDPPPAHTSVPPAPAPHHPPVAAPAPGLDPASGPKADPWNGSAQDSLDNPFGSRTSSADTAEAVQIAAYKRACAVAKRCGNTTPECTALDDFPAAPLPSCPAMQECLRRIDHLSCTQDNPDELGDTIQRITACTEAMRC